VQNKAPFFVPFLYFLKTRCKTRGHMLSWVAIYFLPICIFGWTSGSVTGIPRFVLLMLCLALIYNNYEIGYIENDCETIHRESKPTIRLSAQQLDFYERRKIIIYITRSIVSLFLTGIAIAAGHGSVFPGVVGFLICSWSILLVYFLYNRVRSRLNLPLHFLLVCLRFCAPFYLMTSMWTAFLLSIFLFPVINLTERLTEDRFDIPWARKLGFNDQLDGRYRYYGVVAIGFLTLAYLWVDLRDVLVACGIVAAYLFCYRKLISVWVNRAGL
jgi:hypothetical protein